jgi:hypothetical protein
MAQKAIKRDQRTACQVCNFASDYFLANVVGDTTFCPSCGAQQDTIVQLVVDVLRGTPRLKGE